MRILIIGNTEVSHDNEAYFGRYVDFIKGAVSSDTDFEVAYTFFDDLHIGVGDGRFVIHDLRHDRALSDDDVLLLRGGGFRKYYDVIKAISVYAHEHHLQVINDYQEFRNSSKLTQALQFHQLGLPVAHTVYLTDAVLTATYPLGFDFPCIMKATFGSHGNDNYLIGSLKEAADIAAKDPDKKFVLQRFVPNDKDYRVLVVGEKVAVIGRQAAGDSHLNNTSQGAAAHLEAEDRLPAKIIEQSKQICRSLDMVIAGIDVLQDKQTSEFFFLEVNAQPQLMTGALPEVKAGLLGEYFKDIKRQRAA